MNIRLFGGWYMLNLLTAIALCVLPLPTAWGSDASTQKPATARQANCYRIFTERHATLCKQFARNVNLYCGEPRMQCGVKVHPSMSHLFTEPKWEKMDAMKDFDLVTKVFRAQGHLHPSPGSTPEQVAFLQKKWDTMEPELRRLAVSGRLTLSRARFDPLNVPSYGKPLVYRVEDPRCDPVGEVPGSPSPIFAVIDEKTGTVDERYAQINMDHFAPVIFKGGFTYLTNWQGRRLELWEPAGMNPVCEFEHWKDQ